jgi:hypothetical protein
VLHLLRHKRWSSRAEHERQSRKDEGCSTREAFVYHGTILSKGRIAHLMLKEGSYAEFEAALPI